MATATSGTSIKVTYPVISAAVWSKLRQAITVRRPGAITATYLSVQLKYSSKAARDLIAQLKRIRFIEDDGTLADRAWDWRDDQKYKQVCEDIINDVYPPELRDLVPDTSVDKSVAESWFASTTRSGKGTASNYARFYMMLLDGDPTKLEVPTRSKTAKSPKSNSNGAPSSARASRNGNAKTSKFPHAEEVHAGEPDVEESPHKAAGRGHSNRNIAPSLHLDIQIHIAPDMEASQIDQIFESMAKHLRSLMGEAGE